MSFKSKISTSIAVLGLMLSPVNTAQANDGTYMSVWGGYFYTDAPEVEGFSEYAFPSLEFLRDYPLDAEDGGVFGASFGTPIDPTSLFFKHIEIYFEGQVTEKDKQAVSDSSTTSVTAISSPNGQILVIIPADTMAELERERYEFGANLTLGDQIPNLGPLNLVATIFGGFGNEDVFIRQVNTAGPTVDVDTSKSALDWQFFGLLLGADATIPVSTNMDLILRGAAGVYYFDADAEFVSTSLLATAGNERASDSDSDFGFRGKVSAELRTQITQGMQVSLYGGIDYLSDVPYSKLPDASSFLINRVVPTHIDTDDVLDFKAGIKVTFSLDGQQ